MAAFSVEGFVNPFLPTQKLQQWKRQHKPKGLNSMGGVTMFLGFYSKRKQVIYKLHNLFVFTCNKYIANSEPNSQAQNNYPNSHKRSTRVNRMHPELLMQINRSYASTIHTKQISSTMKRMNLYPFLNEPHLCYLLRVDVFYSWPTDHIVSTSNGHTRIRTIFSNVC